MSEQKYLGYINMRLGEIRDAIKDLGNQKIQEILTAALEFLKVRRVPEFYNNPELDADWYEFEKEFREGLKLK